MDKKTLIFLCDNYPISAREFFVDDEMRVIAPYFEKLVVFTSAQADNAELNRFVPKNMEVIQFSQAQMEASKWKSIWRLFTPLVWNEMLFVAKKISMKYWLKAFKIMYVDVHRAQNLKKNIETYCKDGVHTLSTTNYVFYSYWHDYKALALALLHQKHHKSICISRAHGWDVFAERQHTKYLPFKRFIINNLSKTISISEAGKIAFESYLSKKLDDKVVVSRLGKFNNRTPLLQKTNDEFVICSCSNLIPLKQVDKIIGTLSNLQTKNVRWIHFGDGPMRDQLEQEAEEKLQNVRFEFKGIVPNEKVLDYYSKNYIDLFINLSSSEGIPVSIMEALSAGIPVLATNVGGTNEAVNDNVGFLIEKDFDTRQVALKIDTYFKSPSETQQKYRQNAYVFWQENYEAEKNYNAFFKLINESF